MMTAQWWPWFEFAVLQKVSAAAFRPRPSVDGGLLRINRRAEPLIDGADRRRYHAMVHQVFTGRGRGIAHIVGRRMPRRLVQRWLRSNGIRPSVLPRDLNAAQWADLFALSFDHTPAAKR
jgi:23S rRNA (adenine-N6)-dimethyltransferase